MSEIAIIGHFGGNEYFSDGQTVKTKELYDHINRNIDTNVNILDTYILKYKILNWIIEINKALKKNNKIILIVSTRGYKVLLPILIFLNKFYKRDVYDFVIGGSRHKHLRKNKLLCNMAKKCKFIYVESENMVKKYNELNIFNSVYIPNFKQLNIVDLENSENQNEEIRKVCTFSRVCKEKGIEDAIESVKLANQKLGKNIYELHIFGNVDDGYKERFEAIKLDFPEYIKYRGVVDYKNTVEVLKDFYLLLFPTYHEGEGFPGTIVDAFAAALPVIASDWNCNGEIIKNSITGKIIPINNIKALSEELCYYLNNEQEVKRMKRNCLDEAYKYMPDYALKTFIEELKK